MGNQVRKHACLGHSAPRHANQSANMDNYVPERKCTLSKVHEAWIRDSVASLGPLVITPWLAQPGARTSWPNTELSFPTSSYYRPQSQYKARPRVARLSSREHLCVSHISFLHFHHHEIQIPISNLNMKFTSSIVAVLALAIAPSALAAPVPEAAPVPDPAYGSYGTYPTPGEQIFSFLYT